MRGLPLFRKKEGRSTRCVLWNKWYSENDAQGQPVPQGGILDLEGDSVFEKISKMPYGKPIAPRELDLAMGEDIESLSLLEAVWLCNLGPVTWAIWRGYHIVYSASDYEIVGAA